MKWFKPYILDLKGYSSARSEGKGLAPKCFLDANESPYDNGFNRYPDPYQNELKTLIAEQRNLSPEQCFLGNGSDEVIDLVLRACCNSQRGVLYFTPSYGMYQVSAQIQEIPQYTLALTDDFQMPVSECEKLLQQGKIAVVFLCSPNNPTGNILDNEDIETLLAFKDVLVVVDEAYIDFSTEDSWSKKLQDYPNLLVMQTLSKAQGLAGLRLGMAWSNSKNIEVLNKIKPPYNISIANQQMAIEALKNKASLQLMIEEQCQEREMLSEALNQFSWVKKVYPSQANFVLIEVDNAQLRFQQLLTAGFLVRNRSSQIPNTLRISVGRPTQNKSMLNALQNL